MALPEAAPEIPPDQGVTEVREPELPPAVQDAGVQQAPSQVQPVQGDGGQQIVQPVPAPAGGTPSITVPAQNQEALTQIAKGKADDSRTWFGVFWLFKIKKALKDGIQVLFGGN